MIKTEALSFRYPDGTEALHDVNLEIRGGEFLALMGGNGCGKTTLLKHFIGLLKPLSGKVFLNGKEFRSFKEGEIFKRVGMVFQDPNDQLFAAAVGEDVAFGVVNLGLKPDEVAKRSTESLKMVGISQLFDRAIHTLSFGQKRRAAIAGVLAMNPEVILLDEPTSGLDPRGVSSIMRLLRKLNKEKGITMVMATHDVELVTLFCDRVAIIGQGKIISERTPEKIFADTALIREAGLRLPRIGHLFEILEKGDKIHFEKIPQTIGQAKRELLKFCAHKD
ncbi:ATP-binding cassette domain-containing protein [Thermodesulfovibrionales bacterium]|nr:ATP-binding cassette domain-containing protein [Thermodesulfovibrionales bacterium]